MAAFASSEKTYEVVLNLSYSFISSFAFGLIGRQKAMPEESPRSCCLEGPLKVGTWLAPKLLVPNIFYSHLEEQPTSLAWQPLFLLPAGH